jgi:predicted hydrocarbon binding protein
MMPDLVESLRPFAKKEAKVVEVLIGKHNALLRQAKAVTGLDNGDFDNAMRRSFVSYFVALSGDVQRTLDAAGHTFAHYKKNYRARVDKSEATKY